MERRRLRGTDIMCSKLGLGTWGLGGQYDVDGLPFGWRDVSDLDAMSTIHAALDVGINLFDSSDFYGLGRAEERLGRALQGRHADVVVATKAGIVPRLHPGTSTLEHDFTSTYIRQSVEASLRRLARETIDLLQLHGPGHDELEREELWDALDKLKQSGKVRYIGVSLKSSHTEGTPLLKWLDSALVSAIQMEYSVLHPSSARSLDNLSPRLPIIARSILAHGMLVRGEDQSREFGSNDHRARKWSDAFAARVQGFRRAVGNQGRSILELLLHFALSSPSVSCALVGATSPEQIRQCAAAAEHASTEDERTKLTEAAFSAFGLGDNAEAPNG